MCLSFTQRAVPLFFILAICHSGVRVGELCQALSNHYLRECTVGISCMSVYFSRIFGDGFHLVALVVCSARIMFCVQIETES